MKNIKSRMQKQKNHTFRPRGGAEDLEIYIDYILKELSRYPVGEICKFRNKKNKCLNRYMVNTAKGNHIIAKLSFLNSCGIIPYSKINKDEAVRIFNNRKKIN